MRSFFENKVVWITGASSGIGEALVHELTKTNAKLIVSARNRTRLEAVMKAADLSGARCFVLPLDLSESEKAEKWVALAMEKWGKVDVMIHNGGISQRSMALETSIEVDRKLMEVNYFGTIALTKALLPKMIVAGIGQFVVVSSLVGKFGTPMRSGYAGSKHALHGFFDSLRAELFEKGIGVTLICPGFVHTPLPHKALTGDGSAQGKMDDATENGMAPDIFARKMLSAIVKQKREAWIGGKETFGVYLSRFFPGIFARIIRKAKVT